MRFETTILRPVETSGVGLHSGVPVKVRITPAPPATGIVFLSHIATDLENSRLPAIARSSYASISLMRKGVSAPHLNGASAERALYSMGIDNVFIEIDNLEVPILSTVAALPWMENCCARLGIRTYRPRRYAGERSGQLERGSRQQAHQHPARGPVPAHVRDLLPHAMVAAVLTSPGSPARMEVTPRSAQPSPRARTFGFNHELDQMRDNGSHPRRQPGKCRLLREGRRRPQIAGALRFPDEVLRAKRQAWTSIGDLTLIGRPLLGHVIAERRRARHARRPGQQDPSPTPPSTKYISFDQLASPSWWTHWYPRADLPVIPNLITIAPSVADAVYRSVHSQSRVPGGLPGPGGRRLHRRTGRSARPPVPLDQRPGRLPRPAGPTRCCSVASSWRWASPAWSPCGWSTIVFGRDVLIAPGRPGGLSLHAAAQLPPVHLGQDQHVPTDLHRRGGRGQPCLLGRTGRHHAHPAGAPQPPSPPSGVAVITTTAPSR